MRYKLEDLKKWLKNWLQPKLDYIDSFLNTKPKKILFGVAILAAILLSAYTIALFDAGYQLIKEKRNMFSVSEMFALYSSTRFQYPWGVLLVFILAILLVAALIIYKYGYPTGGRNFKVSRSDVYGSSKELTRKELEQVAVITDKMATTKTILGQFDAIGKEVIAAKPASTEGSIIPNDNMLVFGPPGSGKSTSYVLPFIAQAILRRHSIIASDTKGEVYAKTVELARRHGYRVLRLDLKDPERSDGWNVLKEIRHDDVRSLIFAQTVIANTNTDGEKDIHAGAEQTLLNAVCLYTERCPFLDDSQRTFYYALSLVLQGPEALDTTMQNAYNADNERMQVVWDAYLPFKNGSQNLRGNIVANLSRRISILTTPAIRHLTSTDDIVFEDIGKEPTILYLSLSDQHSAMKFLASLAFSFAFRDLVDFADRCPGQKLPIPVHFMMEEFGSIGYVPNIDRTLSTARSRGISINIVIQTLAQLMETYEENMTSIILADCATWALLGCNDKMSAELMEWRAGEATVEVKTTQHDAMEPAFRLTHRNSTGDGRRAIYTSNDIVKTAARNETLLIFQQLDPLKAKAFPIFQHHEFRAKRMPEISAESLIPLSNKKAKDYLRKQEALRVAAFKTWMKNGGNPLQDYTGFPPEKKGKMTGQPMPDITPLHSLERMALAYAAGVKYDATQDPDSPQYIPPKDEDIEEGEEILEFEESEFVLVGEPVCAESTPATPQKPAKKAAQAAPAEESAESQEPIAITPAAPTNKASLDLEEEEDIPDGDLGDGLDTEPQNSEPEQYDPNGPLEEGFPEDELPEELPAHDSEPSAEQPQQAITEPAVTPADLPASTQQPEPASPQNTPKNTSAGNVTRKGKNAERMKKANPMDYINNSARAIDNSTDDVGIQSAESKPLTRMEKKGKKLPETPPKNE